jgi:uncharacterized membrane protein YbhN (UPF0104 family)
VSKARTPGALSRWYVRLGLSVLVLGVWLALVDLSWQDLAAAFGRVHALSFAAALLAIFANLVAGALRWQCLLPAFGAERPPFGPTLHAYLTAFFFNTFLPANLAGDLLRAGAAARQFHTPSVPFFLVGIERVLGLAGVFLLAGATALASGVLAPALALAALAAGMALSVLALFTSGWVRALSRWLPARWARLRALGELLPVESPTWFCAAVLLSVVTQATFSLGAFVLVLTVAPQADAFGVLPVLPLALLAIYLPTFAGFGSREAAFAFALARYGVSESEATAASLAFGVANLLGAALGGVAYGWRRVG